MQLIDIQKELPPEGVEVFFIDEDGNKDVIQRMGKDHLERDILHSTKYDCILGIVVFEGHWIKE